MGSTVAADAKLQAVVQLCCTEAKASLAGQTLFGVRSGDFRQDSVCIGMQLLRNSTCSETIIKMAQLCVLCKCQAAKKARRRLSESVLPALRAIHRVAWPDRGETSDDPSWSVDLFVPVC